MHNYTKNKVIFIEKDRQTGENMVIAQLVSSAALFY